LGNPDCRRARRSGGEPRRRPNLLNFAESRGTLLTNHHTPLISHTADDIITTLTGNYGEKHGQPVANSYGYFKPDAGPRG
jgi:hypothetical protein